MERVMKKVIVLTLTFVILILIFCTFILKDKTNTIKVNKSIAIMVDNELADSFPSKNTYQLDKVMCDGTEVSATDEGTTEFNIKINDINKTSNC